MKKINFFILLFLFTGTVVFGQSGDKSKNIFSNYSAIINKGEVSLNWRISNPFNLYKFKIESKKAGSENYTFLSDLMYSNFRKKEENDSLISYIYSYSNSPEENGVYFYRISA
ncbi:MAG TPA: hypothetical protein PKD83_05625, partial [Ignavibacteria bacterium]|nr:hypothetical protein [Ignavibacteria bacterium]